MTQPNGVGGEVWELIGSPISVQGIIEQLMKEYEVSREECEHAVKDFLHQMHHANLVIIHA